MQIKYTTKQKITSQKLLIKFIFMITLVIVFQYFYVGCSASIPEKTVLTKKHNLDIIAHRGVHHNYSTDNLKWNDCTATRIFKPTHNYIENTIDSMKAAFEYGATMVEIDIRVTKDHELVVFHDYMLECRTEAEGNVSDFLLEDLQKLDLGYGYTYDGGKTFPFRGKAIGEMKTLIEVLDYFPNKKFLIHNKNGDDLHVAALLADILLKRSSSQQKNLYLWSDDTSYQYVHKKVPLINRLALPKIEQKNFYKSYVLSLGLMSIPEKYKGEGLGLTPEYTKYIWGYPDRFLNKLYRHNIRFYMFVNTPEEFQEAIRVPMDGIITDYIEVIGELSKNLGKQ